MENIEEGNLFDKELYNSMKNTNFQTEKIIKDWHDIDKYSYQKEKLSNDEIKDILKHKTPENKNLKDLVDNNFIDSSIPKSDITNIVKNTSKKQMENFDDIHEVMRKKK